MPKSFRLIIVCKTINRMIYQDEWVQSFITQYFQLHMLTENNKDWLKTNMYLRWHILHTSIYIKINFLPFLNFSAQILEEKKDKNGET